MDEDLARRISALLDAAPDGAPDLSAVINKGRRVRALRALAAGAGTCALIVAVAIAATSIDLTRGGDGSVAPAQHEDGSFVPAEEGDATYVLYDFEIDYPFAKVDGMPGFGLGSERRRLYCSRPGSAEACKRDGNADFFYHWRWSTDRYPGVVACRAVLFDGDGNEVGRGRWELQGLEPTSRRRLHILVHVSDRPTDAHAGCEAGSIGKGRPYRFTFLRAERESVYTRPGEPREYRNKLYFEVEVLDHHATGMCRLRVRYESGATSTGRFTLSGSPREPMEVGAEYRAGDPVVDASLRCGSYNRPSES